MPLRPPEFGDHPFETSQAAFAALQQLAKAEGYAVVYFKSSNMKDGRPRRYDVICACGGKYVSESRGIRKRTSRKTNCPFRVKLVQKRILGDAWCVTVMCGQHNHEPKEPSAFPQHRRQMRQDQDQARAQQGGGIQPGHPGAAAPVQVAQPPSLAQPAEGQPQCRSSQPGMDSAALLVHSLRVFIREEIALALQGGNPQGHPHGNDTTLAILRSMVREELARDQQSRTQTRPAPSNGIHGDLQSPRVRHSQKPSCRQPDMQFILNGFA